MKRLYLTLATGLILLSACQQDAALPPGEAEAFAAQVDAITENALLGLSAADYELHTRDFDKELRERIDPITFPQVYDETIGAYRSHTPVEVKDQGRYRIVVYDAAFENDPHVQVRVVFWKDDPMHRITGLWLDSELLRGE